MLRDVKFIQTINDKSEEGNCVIEYQKKIFCLYDNNLKKIASEINSSILKDPTELNYRNLIQKSIDGEGVTEIQMAHGKTIMVVVVPLTEILGQEISVWGYILTLSPTNKRE